MSAVPQQPAPAQYSSPPPGGWVALAERLHARGDVAGADRAFAMRLREAPNDPALMRAALAMGQDRIPEAEAILREHLRATPNDVPALRMLAELAARIARDDEAVRILARCVELAPGFVAARQQYAADAQPRRETGRGAGADRVAARARAAAIPPSATSRR
jgi:predicted Zn-dependent protease